jgi:DNA-binding NarL/FixJ family response regulator
VYLLQLALQERDRRHTTIVGSGHAGSFVSAATSCGLFGCREFRDAGGAPVTKIRLVIGDDQAMFVEGVREALRCNPDIEIVATADSPAKVLPLLAHSRPDFVLIDFFTPSLDGLVCLDRIKARFPQVKVAVISGVREADVIESVLRRGACAFFLKSINAGDLAAVIRQVVIGTVFHALELVETASNEAAELGLTGREQSILQALARGLSNDAIAKELWITRETVKFHLHNIYRKFGVTNRTEAVMHAFELGLAHEPQIAAASAAAAS